MRDGVEIVPLSPRHGNPHHLFCVLMLNTWYGVDRASRPRRRNKIQNKKVFPFLKRYFALY
jgi:hypothetical protein